MKDVTERGTPLEERLKLALMLAHSEFDDLIEFAGTTEVMRPITRGQMYCRWDSPDWPDIMAGVEEEIALADAEALRQAGGEKA